MNNIYLKILNKYPEILIKPTIKEIISYGNVDLIYPLLWIYKFYFDYNLIVFLPKYKNVNLNFDDFNNFIEDPQFFIKDIPLFFSDLETLENFKCVKNTFTFFVYFDFIYLEIQNKKRFNSLLKKIKSKSKIHILSYCSLKCLNLKSLDSFVFIENKNCLNLNISFIDILNDDPEIYELNKNSFIDLINDFVSQDKKVYLSLNMSLTDIKDIEKDLKHLNITRKENEKSDIVINSSKTTEKIFLKNKYHVYFFIFPNFDEPIEILNYIKDIPSGSEIYIESSNDKNVMNSLKILNTSFKRNVVKDSIFYETMPIIENSLMATESYYKFNIPETQMDISNLNKNDYNLIKNFIKIKLNLLDFEIKTCSICSPSSPKDYSKKLNSLSNKIKYNGSNFVCEIFKDHIGVIVWNEMFDKSFQLTNQTYIYQTTNGKWRTTTIT